MLASLQELFVESRGKPVVVGGRTIIQMDQIVLPENAKVTIQFIGERVYRDNAAILKIEKPGTVGLSDGTNVSAVQTWDEPELPRSVTYSVWSSGQQLKVFNKYRIHHRSGLITEDNFTGNAGMAVTELEPARRLYECSNGPGPFALDDLVFELSWRPSE